MSSCWKCGKSLPEEQVECVPGCQMPDSGPIRLPTFAEVEEIKAMQAVAEACGVLVDHLRRNRAAKAVIPLTVDCRPFKITIEEDTV